MPFSRPGTFFPVPGLEFSSQPQGPARRPLPSPWHFGLQPSVGFSASVGSGGEAGVASCLAFGEKGRLEVRRWRHQLLDGTPRVEAGQPGQVKLETKDRPGPGPRPRRPRGSYQEVGGDPRAHGVLKARCQKHGRDPGTLLLLVAVAGAHEDLHQSSATPRGFELMPFKCTK